MIFLGTTSFLPYEIVWQFDEDSINIVYNIESPQDTGIPAGFLESTTMSYALEEDQLVTENGVFTYEIGENNSLLVLDAGFSMDALLLEFEANCLVNQ